MVSGPHGDPVVIEEAADVIGVMLTEVESNYPFTLRRAVKDQIRYRAQGIERVAHQRLLILGNLRQSQLADVGQRRAEANDPPGIRRAGLKAPRRLVPGGALRQADGGDHRPAPFPRRHRLQQLGPGVEHADPGRPIQLVGGENIKIAAQRLDVYRVVHHRLGAIHQHFRAMLMRKSNQRRQRVFRPQHVGDLGYRQQAGARVKQSRDNIQLQRTVRVQGDHPQLSPDAGAQHLPRHNIGVVLHFADDDVIPGADVGVSPAVGHQVDTLGGAADEHHFLRRPGVKEGGRLLTHGFHPRGGFRAEGMDAAVHRRVAVAIEFRFGADHCLRLLGAGGAVEIDQRLTVDLPVQYRKIGANLFY